MSSLCKQPLLLSQLNSLNLNWAYIVNWDLFYLSYDIVHDLFSLFYPQFPLNFLLYSYLFSQTNFCTPLSYCLCPQLYSMANSTLSNRFSFFHPFLGMPRADCCATNQSPSRRARRKERGGRASEVIVREDWREPKDQKKEKN